MNIILLDGEEWENLLPLTYLKPFSLLRMGALTFAERWEKLLNFKTSYYTEPHLQKKYPINLETENLFINPAFFPTEELVQKIKNLSTNQCILYNNYMVAVKTTDDIPSILDNKIYLKEEVLHIKNLWDLFIYNFHAIEFDFNLLVKGRKSEHISKTNNVLYPERIFIEEGARVEFSTLNATEGPIYIGKNSEIMEGSLIRGGLSLCNNAKINMGTKIYPGCTIGPYCKVGGELNNSILSGYSNKSHDGFLGNSVIGEWCNLGADTNTSNLKNNYSEVKLWNFKEKKFLNTGLQFCGLIMGDFSKSSINTQFNTGTVIGVSANVFHVGFPPKIVKNYSWGGKSDSPTFIFDKACEAMEKMMERRNVKLSYLDREILEYVFKLNNN